MKYTNVSCSRFRPFGPLRLTVAVAVAGQAGLLGRAPVVVLPAALAVRAVRVVPTAQTAPPAARAAVLLQVKRAAVRAAAAVAPWKEVGKKAAGKTSHQPAEGISPSDSGLSGIG